jgi:sterol desaturase/sphingolipid hydroxylase (fatty acid hydroxylase superfamily)
MFALGEWFDYFKHQFTFFLQPSHGLYVGYLLVAGIIATAYGCYQLRTGNVLRSLQYLKHLHLVNNVSFGDDVKLFIVDKLLLGFIYTFLFGVAVFFKERTILIMDFFELSTDLGEAPFFVTILYTAGVLIVFDFGTFFEHYLSHKYKFLWEFHKVHHIPTHLNPITAYRSHPVNQGLFVVLTGSLMGIFSGVVGAFYPGQSLTWVLAGQNGLMCLLLVLGLNLQHSHVQLRYPRVLRDIFVSPAYHQVHHSRSKRHYNKNFGFIFSFWDRLFGTQVHLNQNTELEFGLQGEPYHQYSGIINHYLTPFLKVARMRREKRKRLGTKS